MATPTQLRALLAVPELLAAAAGAPDDLAVAERLRKSWPADLVAAATAQAALRARARAKFEGAADMLLTRAGLEQASGDTVAAHRAQRFRGLSRVVDLCCGIGGDLAALSVVADHVVGVDVEETHAICARHNASLVKAVVSVAVADVHDVVVRRGDAAFVDPARRTTTAGSTDRRGGYSPTLDWCFGLTAARICVKAAPGIDSAVVPAGWEREFVAVGRDLKEATLWSPEWATAGARATVLPSGASMVASATAAPAPVLPPGRFLLDPSPAVTRAGAVADLAAAVGGWQIDPRIAFLSRDAPIVSAFGRSFLVEASLPFGVKRLAAELRRLDVGSIDVRRRGLAGDVEELRRRMSLSGSRRATVMLTRVVDKPWTLICTDLPGT